MAFSTQGSQLRILIGSAFVPIANRTRIRPNEATRPEIDITDLDSVATETLPGFPSYGDFEFELNYNPTNFSHAYVYDSFQNVLGGGVGVVETWQQVLANGSVAQVTGWVSSWARGEQAPDTLQKVTVKVKVTSLEQFFA